MRNKKYLILSLFLGSVVFLYQNCGKVNFTNETRSLGTVNTAVGLGSPVVLPASPPASAGDTSIPPKSPPPPTSVDNKSSDPVECDLLGPNTKIIVSSAAVLAGSNNSSTRACMSQNACLNLINNYVQARHCSLSRGPASAAVVTSNCTDIFPGSQGTCQNAQVLSDSDIVSILAAMAK